MEFTTIDFKEEEGIGTIILNRPDRLNAINSIMFSELIQVFDIIEKSNSIRVVIITGTGRAFCAGGDAKDMSVNVDMSSVSTMAECRKVIQATKALANLSKPVISAVNGIATGAGVNIALAGDIIIAAETATFSEIFVKVGLTPDMGGTYFLPRAVGRAVAKEMVFTGKMIDAQEAQKLGLITHVVPKENLIDAANDMARKIAQGPPVAIINKSFELDLASALENELNATFFCLQTEDHAEAVRAFVEKRKPFFKGK